MADYKRMVSYMYQYEKGVKRKNVGYARVEVRNGQSKITLHMQMPGLLDGIFPTYLIERDDNGMELIYLGDSMLRNQVMDSKLSSSEVNIMDSGYSFAQIGGILLFLNEDTFYATEWDDKPIVAKEVMEALKPKKRGTSKEVSKISEEGQIVLDRNGQNEPYATASVGEQKIDISKAVETVVDIKPLQDAFEKDDTKSLSEEVADADADSSIETISEISSKSEEAVKSEEASPSEEQPGGPTLAELEDMIPKYKLPRGYKTIERLQNYKPFLQEESKDENIQKASSIEETVMESKADANLADTESMETVSREVKLEDIIEEALQSNDMGPEEVEAAGRRTDMFEERNISNDRKEEERAENPTAARIFANYPRIYPFEDNEITICVKIEPKDIGYLPMEVWGLSNNSFLMHGYYCYHHLIFAKMNNRFGCRYILGIPGIYHNREQFMARMFGFDNFKSIRKRELRPGDFGYWYLPLNL